MKTLLIAWPASVLLAGYLGYQLAPQGISEGVQSEQSHSVESTVLPEATAPSPAVPAAHSRNSKTTAPTLQSPDVAFSSEEIVSRARSMMGTSSFSLDFKGVANVYGLIQGLTEEQLESILLEYFVDGVDTTEANILAIFISQYAEHNPQGAMDFIEANIDAPQAKMISIISAIKAWTNRDPEGAFGWFEVQKRQGKNQGLLGGAATSLVLIFDGLAKESLDLALDHLYRLEDSPRHLQMAISGIANAMDSRAEFAQLLTKTKALDNDQIRLSIVSAWGARSPREISQWLDDEYLGEDRDKLRDRTMSTWMLSDPERSADWYMQGASSQSRQESIEKVMNNWGMSSPQDALQWLNTQRDIDYESALVTLLTDATFSHSEFVMENMELLEEQENKSDLAFNLYLALKHQSEAKAAEYLNASPYKAHIQERVSYINDDEGY